MGYSYDNKESTLSPYPTSPPHTHPPKPNMHSSQPPTRPTSEPRHSSSSRRKIIICSAVVAVVLIGLAIGLGVYFGTKDKDESSENCVSDNPTGEAAIGGNCWKGCQCKPCGQDVAIINGVKVCCAHCASYSQTLSGGFCFCRKN